MTRNLFHYLLRRRNFSAKNNKIKFFGAVGPHRKMQAENQTQQNVPITTNGLPPKQGLYDPQFEHDACGVGFVVNMKGRKSHSLVEQALQILVNLDHRGACGCEANTGDGAGILMQMPHEFFKRATDKSGFKLPNMGQYGVGMLFMPKD